MSVQYFGKYKLVEKESHGDTICRIYLGTRRLGVYCSVYDAIAHKCEWFEEE